MKFLEVVRNIDDLNRKVWTFSYFDNWHTLYLDVYALECRKTKRHGWKGEARYYRLDSRYNTIKLEDVELPIDVINEIKANFFNTLQVKLWDRT